MRKTALLLRHHSACRTEMMLFLHFNLSETTNESQYLTFTVALNWILDLDLDPQVKYGMLMLYDDKNRPQPVRLQLTNETLTILKEELVPVDIEEEEEDNISNKVKYRTYPLVNLNKMYWLQIDDFFWWTKFTCINL